MNGLQLNKIPNIVKLSLFLWAAIVVYYILDIYIIYPMTGQVYNFISPFIIFGFIALAFGLLMYPFSFLIIKTLKSLKNRFNIRLKSPVIFILKNIKSFFLLILSFIFTQQSNADHDEINIESNNDLNIDPSITDYGKPTSVSNHDWNLRKTEITEEYDIGYQPFDKSK